jgi:HD-GYP domain-containing protein (c-di-GMP phosphodiesterase class II)
VIEQKTDINDLRIGMYVSRLDRAWVDTPFMFQGFYIHDDEDIIALRKHCRYVYTDTTKENIADHMLQTLVSTKQSTSNSIAGLPVRKVHYVDTASVEDEIVIARECHADLSRTVDNIIADVKSGNTIDLNKAKKTVDNMIDSIARNPDAFTWLTKLKDKDSYTYRHSMDVSILAVTLGRHLGLSKNELKELAIGSLLFDIGKIKIPANVLNKPGRLTEEEFELVRKHVDFSVEIMQKIKGMPARAIEIARFHHERHNGKGYPQGLQGTEIPVFARIAAIVDCYDAITSDRTYSRAISSHDAIKQLYEWGNIDFQIELIEQFIQCLGIYPTGSLVELSTGQVGVILSQNRVRRLRPKVMLILDPHKVAYDSFPIVDLVTETHDENGNAIDIVATHEPGAFGIDPTTFYL